MNQLWWSGLMLTPIILLGSWIGSAPVSAELAKEDLAVEPQASLDPGKQIATETQTPADLNVVNPVTTAQTFNLQGDTTLKPLRSRVSSSLSNAVPSVQSLEQPSSAGDRKKATKTKSLSQVTSVSQLSDVQPTDWAFQAVQSLVERYGCIEGYPDQTFRGSRAATRYELAAALNACLNQLSAQLGGLTPEDLATIKRLQDEFAAELAILRGRVDVLEARTTELEGNQFSTTTRLSVLGWFNITGATASGPIQVEAAGALDPPVLRLPGRDGAGNPIVQTIDEDPNITFSNLVWLTLDTSFTGQDILTVQLATGNGDSPANVFTSAGLYNSFGVPYTDQTAGTTIGVNDVVLRELSYTFPVDDILQVVVGPRINFYRYFDNNAFTFFLTGAGSFDSIGGTLSNEIDRGAGVILLFDFNEKVKLNIGYLAESDEFLPNPPYNTANQNNRGLFDATNTITAELFIAPVETFNLRLLYTRSNIQAISFFPGAPAIVGGAVGEPLYQGFADDGLGGSLNDASADNFMVNFDWLVTSGFGIFGRYSYSSTHLDPVNPLLADGDVNAQSFQAGIAFPDLGREGALAVITYLMPFDILDGEDFLISGGGDGGTQYEVEASYYFPINDNVALVPSFYAIFNANNFSDNPNIYVGNLRTQFSF